MSAQWPTLDITVADGRTVLTTVHLDGKPLPVTRVSFDTGESLDGNVKVRIEMYVDLRVHATGQKLMLVSPDE